MQKVLIILTCLAVAACASPRAACIADANREFRTVNTLVAQTQATVDRGYGVRRTQRITTIVEPCLSRRGTGRWCERSIPVRQREVFAVDVRAERRKLADLKAKRAALLTRATKNVAQCKVDFPDS